MSLTLLPLSAPTRRKAYAAPDMLRRLGVVVTIGASAFASSSPRISAQPRPSIQQSCDAPVTTTSVAFCSLR